MVFGTVPAKATPVADFRLDLLYCQLVVLVIQRKRRIQGTHKTYRQTDMHQVHFSKNMDSRTNYVDYMHAYAHIIPSIATPSGLSFN